MEKAVQVLVQLFAIAARGTEIDTQKVDYTIALSKEHQMKHRKILRNWTKISFAIRFMENRLNLKRMGRKPM